MRTKRAESVAAGGLATIPVEEPHLESFERRVRLLTSGGPIIGAFADCEYEQEAIQMGLATSWSPIRTA